MPPQRNNHTERKCLPSIGFCSPPSIGNCSKPNKEAIKQKKKMGQDLFDYLDNEFNRLSPEEQDRAYKNLYGLGSTIGDDDDDHGVDNNNSKSNNNKDSKNNNESNNENINNNNSRSTYIDESEHSHHHHEDEDDPMFIQEKLQQFEYAIQLIKKKDAYDRAIQECPDYVMDRDFRLMFLRSSDYDPKVAGKRMVQHWKVKLQLFGPERTYSGRRININDLDNNDLDTLKSGGLQFIQGTDRAGRGITWSRQNVLRYKTKENALRAGWYVAMEASYDEHVQKNGIVHILFNNDLFQLGKFDRDTTKQLMNIFIKCAPMKYVGSHICFDDFKFKIVAPFMFMFMGPKQRVQCKLHTDSSTDTLLEISYKFGIPLDIMPIDLEGNFNYQSHLDWINKKIKENNDGDDDEEEVL